MKSRHKEDIIIKDLDVLQERIITNQDLSNVTIKSLDLREANVDFSSIELKDTTFLGCKLKHVDETMVREKGAALFPAIDGLPYEPFRSSLYTWQELMTGGNGFEAKSVDRNIYDHFSESRFKPDIREALAQRIHDHSIDDALRELLVFDDMGMTSRKCVGIMGGHSTSRQDPFYKKTAFAAKRLAESGYFVASGGGPGIMEAANLGAYFSDMSDKALDAAIELLSPAPDFHHKHFNRQAQEVLERFPGGKENLAIPTWFYGHEPSNLFASHIAKYFSNSIREDTLLAISLYGIIFAPGSAGTTQEIFMDAAQNHYVTYGYCSPMVFLGKERYEIQTLIYPLLKQLSWEKTYNRLLFISDDPSEVVSFIQSHPPVKTED